MLNSCNDCVVHKRSGQLLFTDPTYGYEAQKFRTSSAERKGVWSVHPQRARSTARGGSWARKGLRIAFG